MEDNIPPSPRAASHGHEHEALDLAVRALHRLARGSQRLPVCVVSLSQQLGVTPYQLGRCFHRQFGMSMEAYLKRHPFPAREQQWIATAI